MAEAPMDKAVILARGLGTRMRRREEHVSLEPSQEVIATMGLKAMIPVGRPFLDYVLSALADAGYRQVCLVVAPEHEVIRRYYDQVGVSRFSIHYAVQSEPRGTADAVAAAESFVGDDPFLVINSDNYYPPQALAELRHLSGFGTALFEEDAMFTHSNIAPERIRQFAVGQIDSNNLLRRIVEKPDDSTLSTLPRPLWISMNCWRFCRPIFQACRNIPLSPRGEYELPDAVQYVIDVLGEPVQVVKIRAAVFDLTSRRDVATIAPKLASVSVSL